MKLSDSQIGERPTPREMSEIFEDLRVLAQTDGALHNISSIIYRDWVQRVDIKEGKVVDNAERRWSTGKLNKNELLLLLGLTVQSSSSRTYSVLSHSDEFLARADRLLLELHDTLIVDYTTQNDVSNEKLAEGPDVLSALAREAIYYGAESFYLHQYKQFSRHRYRQDGDWLLGNVGISIRPMLDIARFIVDRINLKMTATVYLDREINMEDQRMLTDSLLVSKNELVEKFGEKAKAFISKFATPIMNANPHYTKGWKSPDFRRDGQNFPRCCPK